MNKRLKRAGNIRHVITLPVTTDIITVPAGFAIVGLYTEKLDTTASNFSLGTSAAGHDVIDTVALGTTSDVVAKQAFHTGMNKMYSTTADTSLHITLSAPCALNIYVQYQLMV